MGTALEPARGWIASETTMGLTASILGSAEKRARSKAGAVAAEKAANMFTSAVERELAQLDGPHSQSRRSTGWRTRPRARRRWHSPTV
eukprot:1123292-Rhodomonas_salina.1